MSKTIWKVALPLVPVQGIQVSHGAKILTVQMQDGRITLWLEVDPNAPVERRKIEIFGTGHEITPDYKRRYIGTVQHEGFVWHVYERE